MTQEQQQILLLKARLLDAQDASQRQSSILVELCQLAGVENVNDLAEKIKSTFAQTEDAPE